MDELNLWKEHLDAEDRTNISIPIPIVKDYLHQKTVLEKERIQLEDEKTYRKYGKS